MSGEGEDGTETMRLRGKARELFDAFSSLAEQAGDRDALLSCAVLTKVPSYGDILRRFAANAPPLPPPRLPLLLARCYLINAAHLAALLMARLALWLAGSASSPKLKDGPALVIDTFLLADRTLENGEYREAYLPGLAQAAREEGWRPLLFFRLFGSRNPIRLYRVFRFLRQSGVEWTSDIQLLSLSDWLQLLRHLFLYPSEHLGLVGLLDGSPMDSPGRFIRETLLSCLPACHMVGESRRLASRRLALQLPAGSRIVSWFENQVADKALYRGLQQAEKLGAARIPVVGAQLYIWPSTLINYHLDPVDVRRGLVPDRMVVCGPRFIPERPLIPYGLGPSLRYTSLFPSKEPGEEEAGEAGHTRTSNPLRSASGYGTSGEKPLLVLLSFHRPEIERALALVRDYAASLGRVAYKFHPATDPAGYADLLPTDPCLEEGSLSDAARRSKAAFGSGSGALIEAAVLGLPVLVIPEQGDLSGIEELLPEKDKGIVWEAVSRPDEVAEKIRRLDAGNPQERLGRAGALRNALFTRPDGQAMHRAFFA